MLFLNGEKMNRKSWLLVKIVILLVIVISLSNLFLRLLFHEFDWNNIGFEVEDMEDIKSRESVYQGVERVQTSLVNIPIEIRETSNNQVKLIDTTEAKNWFKKFHPIRVEQRGNQLVLEQKNGMSFFGFFFSKSAWGNIVLEVPKERTLEYDLETVSGEIILDVQSKGKLEIESVSGNVDVYQGGEYLNIESVSGNIKIQKPFIEIEGETISGDMDFVANENSQKISSDSVSGDTKIYLQNIEDYDLEFSTVSGEIVDSEKRIGEKSGNIQNSTSRLRIEFDSVSGDLKVNRRE